MPMHLRLCRRDYHIHIDQFNLIGAEEIENNQQYSLLLGSSALFHQLK
jgi:hypothetical protein